jgi:hypothetical protein
MVDFYVCAYFKPAFVSSHVRGLLEVPLLTAKIVVRLGFEIYPKYSPHKLLRCSRGQIAVTQKELRQRCCHRQSKRNLLSFPSGQRQIAYSKMHPRSWNEKKIFTPTGPLISSVVSRSGNIFSGSKFFRRKKFSPRPDRLFHRYSAVAEKFPSDFFFPSEKIFTPTAPLISSVVSRSEKISFGLFSVGKNFHPDPDRLFHRYSAVAKKFPSDSEIFPMTPKSRKTSSDDARQALRLPCSI